MICGSLSIIHFQLSIILRRNLSPKLKQISFCKLMDNVELIMDNEALAES